MDALLLSRFGALVASVLAARLLWLALYRLFFCPIAAFPGPVLAKLTFWYEGYWDVWRQGSYTWKIRQLHQKYGPIVRINPEELHVQDLDFYDQVYVGAARRTDKWHWSAKMFGTTQAAVGTVDHDLHRLRRHALNPFFSKSAVVRLEPVIEANVNRLVGRLRQYENSGEPVNMSDAFTALSADVIGSYAFGESYHFLAGDIGPRLRTFMMDLSRGTHLMKQFGWAYTILTYVPEPLVSLVHPLSRELFKLRRGIAAKVAAAASAARSCPEKGGEQPLEGHSIFRGLFTGSRLPSNELSRLHLTEEGLTIIGAGTVTTAHTLSTILFHVLANASIAARLRSELESFSASLTSAQSKWTLLSQLPYLSSVVNEGLRLSYGVSHRLQRIAPDTDLAYRELIIPRGTPVSMTNMFIHEDPVVFPRAKEFLPERWLDEDASLPSCKDAKRFLVPFSRGTRACLGMNLAYAELFLALAAIFLPSRAGGLNLELFETDKRDVECVHDFFNPSARLDSKGVQVLVKS